MTPWPGNVLVRSAVAEDPAALPVPRSSAQTIEAPLRSGRALSIGSMDGAKARKNPPPLLLTTSMDKKTKKPPLPLPSVKLAAKYALFSACAIYASFAIAYPVTYLLQLAYGQSWVSLPCFELTDAQVMEASALANGVLWCSAPQAAAAALALLLAGGRRGRALAFVALAIAAANHSMCARFVGVLLVAAPARYLLCGFINALGVVFFAVCDLLGFMAIFLGEDE
ncbi:hypothetical protein ACP70R_042010 [Stipagrostis hirtigluma subsp. patula]